MLHTFKICLAGLFLASLLESVTGRTYREVKYIKEKCKNDTIQDTCNQFNPLTITTYKQVDACSEDYYKSDICFYAFDSCASPYASGKDEDLNQQMPVYCWNCLVESPAESDLYYKYQQCMIVLNQGYHILGTGLLLLVVLALIFA